MMLFSLSKVMASGYVNTEDICLAAREILASVGEAHSAWNSVNILNNNAGLKSFLFRTLTNSWINLFDACFGGLIIIRTGLFNDNWIKSLILEFIVAENNNVCLFLGNNDKISVNSF